MADGEPEQDYEDPRNVRILKRVVYIMGIMLVVGAIVVIGTIIYRAVNFESRRGASAPAGPVFADLDISVGEGARIGSIELDGNRMAVHISNNGSNEILLIDMRKGTLLGRVKLNK